MRDEGSGPEILTRLSSMVAFLHKAVALGQAVSQGEFVVFISFHHLWTMNRY